MEPVLYEEIPELEKFEERLSLHTQMTYITAMHALRYIKEVLESVDGNDTKTILCKQAGGLVFDMLDATYNASLHNGDNEEKYLNILAESNGFIDAAVQNSLIQSDDEKTAPDREILRIINHVCSMGQRMTEKMLDFTEEKMPPEYIYFVSLDKVCSRLEKMMADGKIDGKISEKDFKSIHSYEFKEYEKNLTRDSALDTKRAIVETRQDCCVDFSNKSAKYAAIAMDHVIAGLDGEPDEDKRALYYRTADIITSMKNALLSDDIIYSAEKHFDSAMHGFIVKVTTPEERLEVDADMMGKVAPDSENVAWEFSTTLEKLNNYERIIGESNMLMDDISRHELLKGDEYNGNNSKPDIHLLFTVELLNNMAHWMGRSANLLYDALVNPQISSHSQARIPDITSCARACADVWNHVMKSETLHDACSTITNFYGKTEGKEFVLEKRVEPRIYNSISEIIGIGGPQAEQRVEAVLNSE